MPNFVVQEHTARTHHFDFRLEKDGVYKSWAVPKGIPVEPGLKRLAVQVENHALEYGRFEGEIPPGQYGAGTVSIWDKGQYEVHEWTPARIVVSLEGSRLVGRYSLVRFKRGKERDWLIFRHKSNK